MEATQNNGQEVMQPKDTAFPQYVQDGFQEYQSEKQDLNTYVQDNKGNILSPDAVLQKYAYLQITDSADIPEPEPVVKIGGEVISTEGNITTISGASKSGKSAFTSVLIAGAVAGGEYDGFPDVEVLANDSHRAVIHLDTEQARAKHKRNLCTILERADLNTCPDYLLSYNIRQLPLKEYQTATSEICEAANAIHGGIFLIVIDGIADYIQDVNDPESSNAIVSYFEKLAIKYACPIICIVHTNPNSDKERGHLGSQLQRKSESVLTVETDNDISTLKPKFLRNAGKGKTPLIQFRYNPEKHYHEYCGVMTTAQADRDAARIEAIKEIAKQVFSGQKAYGYNEGIEAIMKVSKKQERTAKDMFREMKVHGFIQVGEDKKYRSKME